MGVMTLIPCEPNDNRSYSRRVYISLYILSHTVKTCTCFLKIASYAFAERIRVSIWMDRPVQLRQWRNETQGLMIAELRGWRVRVAVHSRVNKSESQVWSSQKENVPRENKERENLKKRIKEETFSCAGTRNLLVKSGSLLASKKNKSKTKIIIRK